MIKCKVIHSFQSTLYQHILMKFLKTLTCLFALATPISKAMIAGNWDANLYDLENLTYSEKLFIDAVRFNSGVLVEDALEDASTPISTAAINYGAEEACRLENKNALGAIFRHFPNGLDAFDDRVQKAVEHAFSASNEEAVHWLIDSPLQKSFDYSKILMAAATSYLSFSPKSLTLCKYIINDIAPPLEFHTLIDAFKQRCLIGYNEEKKRCQEILDLLNKRAAIEFLIQAN